MSGWGVGVFTEGNYFFWIPMLAPFVGALLSSFVYSIFIRNHWPKEDAYDDDYDDNYSTGNIQIQFTKKT
jgi:hypothetical protein